MRLYLWYYLTTILLYFLFLHFLRLQHDDFGIGYSSLSYLKNLPSDKLKIDISFVRNITHEAKNQTIVKAIITLAKGLGMSVLAEGVQSSEELEFLCQNGIDSVQGYYYYKPMPLLEMTSLLLEQSIGIFNPKRTDDGT